MNQQSLAPFSDTAFALLFGDAKNEPLLRSFLSAIIDVPANDLEH